MNWENILTENVFEVDDEMRMNLMEVALEIKPAFYYAVGILHKKEKDLVEIVMKHKYTRDVLKELKKDYEYIFNDLYFVCVAYLISEFFERFKQDIEKTIKQNEEVN